jgi:hypothetical protein
MRPYHRLLSLLLLTGGALLVTESAGLAQGYGPAYGPPPPPPRYYSPQPRYAAPAPYYAHTHDGLFVRLTLGAGYLSASESDGQATLAYSGLGLTASGALGGTIAPNLVLFGEMMGTSVVNAEQTYGGVSEGLSGLDLVLFGFGPGLAYYIEPANVYLSGTLAFSKISFSDTYSQYKISDTNFGVGGSFVVGKEWWVGRSLGLGVAGQLHVASMTDPYYNTRMTATAFSVVCSATFN